MHSVLRAHWTYAVRTFKKKSTSAQRVAGALNEWPAHEARMKRACSAHAARMQRALNAQPANGRVIPRRLYGFIVSGRRAKASSPTKNRAPPGCRWEEVLDQGSLDYHLQRIPSALMHCRLEHLMLIPYRR